MQRLPSKIIPFSFYFFKKQPFAFLCFFIAPIVMVIESNVIPYALKMVIDAVEQNPDKSQIFTTVKPALILGGVSWLCLVLILRLQNWWQAYVVPKFQADIRLTVLDHVTKNSVHYFSSNLSGNLAAKISDLAFSIENIRLSVTWNIISTVLIIIVAIVLMATINIMFSIIITLWVIINIALIVHRAKTVNKTAERNADDQSKIVGVFVDIISNIIPVKLFARQKHEQKFAKEIQATEQESNKRLILNINIYRWWIDIPVTIMLCFLTYFLIKYWQRGLISTGDFVFVMNSSFGIITSIWNFSERLIDLFREIGTVRQSLYLLSHSPEVTDKPDAKDLIVNTDPRQRGKIEFRNVSFTYHKGTKIFNNKNIIIHPGEKVGLVGYSGSGKSSFINLILRFYDVQSGQIFIDDQNIADVRQESLRSKISMIPQDTTLFHRTLMENIRYGNPDATDQDVIEASKKAHCHEFISKLQDGYHTIAGERGSKLSGGQRQRIAIARALLEDAPILILDEATSALDSLTEALIQESLQLLMKERTTIVVAHRLSTLLDMDRVLVFHGGKIIEDGSHKELIAKNGHYSQLWRMQVGGFLPD